MDTNQFVEKLTSKEPLFAANPKVAVHRVVGGEIELGVGTCDDGSPDIAVKRLPRVFQNGGEAYVDCDHVESCTPEVSNAASLVAYQEAGKRLCVQERFSPRLFCHNNDWRGATFGAHENYFTSAHRNSWRKILPFLVARVVIEGAGWFSVQGTFRISQRAQHVVCVVVNETTVNRAIINTRRESLAQIQGWDRMHLICGDANMCELPAFLKFALTELVISMLEIGALPNIRYEDSRFAVEDLHVIAGRTGGWVMSGVRGCDRLALSVLARYVARAEELFTGRDEVTDVALALAGWVIEKLATDPMRLVGYLDWPTKLWMLNAFNSAEGEATKDRLRDMDLSYHNLDPEKGLYFHLLRRREVARIVSDEFITHAMEYPPPDTRAFARGEVVRELRTQGDAYVAPRVWTKIIVVPTSNTSPFCNDRIEWALPDPRSSYEATTKQLLAHIRRIRNGGIVKAK